MAPVQKDRGVLKFYLENEKKSDPNVLYNNRKYVLETSPDSLNSASLSSSPNYKNTDVTKSESFISDDRKRRVHTSKSSSRSFAAATVSSRHRSGEFCEFRPSLNPTVPRRTKIRNSNNQSLYTLPVHTLSSPSIPVMQQYYDKYSTSQKPHAALLQNNRRSQKHPSNCSTVSTHDHYQYHDDRYTYRNLAYSRDSPRQVLTPTTCSSFSTPGPFKTSTSSFNITKRRPLATQSVFAGSSIKNFSLSYVSPIQILPKQKQDQNNCVLSSSSSLYNNNTEFFKIQQGNDLKKQQDTLTTVGSNYVHLSNLSSKLKESLQHHPITIVTQTCQLTGILPASYETAKLLEKHNIIVTKSASECNTSPDENRISLASSYEKPLLTHAEHDCYEKPYLNSKETNTCLNLEKKLNTTSTPSYFSVKQNIEHKKSFTSSPKIPNVDTPTDTALIKTVEKFQPNTSHKMKSNMSFSKVSSHEQTSPLKNDCKVSLLNDESTSASTHDLSNSNNVPGSPPLIAVRWKKKNNNWESERVGMSYSSSSSSVSSLSSTGSAWKRIEKNELKTNLNKQSKTTDTTTTSVQKQQEKKQCAECQSFEKNKSCFFENSYESIRNNELDSSLPDKSMAWKYVLLFNNRQFKTQKKYLSINKVQKLSLTTHRQKIHHHYEFPTKNRATGGAHKFTKTPKKNIKVFKTTLSVTTPKILAIKLPLLPLRDEFLKKLQIKFIKLSSLWRYVVSVTKNNKKKN